jgi:hypothetical protein
MKKEILKAAEQYGILSGADAENAIDFVAELLHILVEDTIENEPNATKSIDRYEEIERGVRQLQFDLSDEIDGLDE